MTLVVLQMGHVARTRGVTGVAGEQTYARGVADRATPLLRALGCTVRVIGADESKARYRGDLFVAIHYDGGPPSARGPSVGYRTTEGRTLATAWKTAYNRHAKSLLAPFRKDNYTAALAGYYGHRHAVNQGNRAAIIVEGGFGTNAVEGPWLRSNEGMTANALAIRDAVAAYTGREAIPTFDAPIEDDMTPEDRALLVAIKGELEAIRKAIGDRPGFTSLANDHGYTRRGLRALLDNAEVEVENGP